MSRWARIAGWVFAAALILYFMRYVFASLESAMWPRLLRPQAIAATALAAVLSMAVIPLTAYVWRMLLLSMGEIRSWRELCGILGSTQAAKYLPGNVAQHATRVALALRRGITAYATGASITIEMVLAVAAAAAVSMVFLAMAPENVNWLPPRMHEALFYIGIAVPVLLFGLPRLLQAALGAMRKVVATGRLPATLRLPSRGTQAVAFGLYLVNYMLLGLGFLAIARAFHVDAGFLQLTAAFAVAWIGGFIAPGVPAGIGVREGIVVAVLGGGLPDEAIVGAVAAMRMATVAGDLAWFAFGALLLARSGPKEAK